MSESNSACLAEPASRKQEFGNVSYSFIIGHLRGSQGGSNGIWKSNAPEPCLTRQLTCSIMARDALSVVQQADRLAKKAMGGESRAGVLIVNFFRTDHPGNRQST